jgi:hypothetical protein
VHHSKQFALIQESVENIYFDLTTKDDLIRNIFAFIEEFIKKSRRNDTNKFDVKPKKVCSSD